ncbi:hypothetical protein Taro_025231 [Colocasia esculenta]|uniref:Uncharacterized protein n=1 Tax=Colocasia esculenta TaxID=4460 RepID=A0A843V2Q1_COLES|nr:hypothetical protein [Colocasia esculenta]
MKNEEENLKLQPFSSKLLVQNRLPFFSQVSSNVLGNPMISAPTTKACTCLPPALFCGMAQFVTVFASGLVVRGGRSGDFGLSLLAWPISDT